MSEPSKSFKNLRSNSTHNLKEHYRQAQKYGKAGQKTLQNGRRM